MNIFHHVSGQFEKPYGILGRLIGHIMATRRSNIERSDWTLSLLKIKPTDRILEIGFGPGIAIGKAAKIAAEVVGIDHSIVMLNQATRRNKELIRKEKLKLFLGSAGELDNTLGLFDKIYSVNVVQFWESPGSIFGRLRSLLKSGGEVVTAYLPRYPGATDEDAFAKGNEIAESLRQAGLKNIQIERKMMKPVAVVAVVATKA